MKAIKIAGHSIDSKIDWRIKKIPNEMKELVLRNRLNYKNIKEYGTVQVFSEKRGCLPVWAVNIETRRKKARRRSKT
ncbi:MAG: hypothetical protein LBL45_08615 [Treponema sp.]|nr:hypothetical protein [Treponema sp.]